MIELRLVVLIIDAWANFGGCGYLPELSLSIGSLEVDSHLLIVDFS